MKYISVFVLILLFASCSVTKRATESKPQKEVDFKKEEIIKDTISEKATIIDVEIDTTSNFKEVQKDSVLQDILYSKPSYISVWNNLLQNYVSENGNVNYSGFKDNWLQLKGYIDALGKNTPNENWTKQDKLAYWINAYNAMTIDLMLRHYPLKSIKDIKNPWEQRYWKMGDKWYNLNEIEHQILRKMNEPRIHFAIVCASFSCPKLQNEAFTSEALESQLTDATTEFLNDPERNVISENSLELSKIFQWFSKDFKQNGSLIDFINQYSSIKILENAKIKFKDYNWAINE